MNATYDFPANQLKGALGEERFAEGCVSVISQRAAIHVSSKAHSIAIATQSGAVEMPLSLFRQVSALAEQTYQDDLTRVEHESTASFDYQHSLEFFTFLNACAEKLEEGLRPRDAFMEADVVILNQPVLLLFSARFRHAFFDLGYTFAEAFNHAGLPPQLLAKLDHSLELRPALRSLATSIYAGPVS